jgi:tetratricopeptide (TPR) repeat protein
MEMYRNRFNLGITLRRLGRIEDSIDELKKACDLQPNKAASLNNLGLSQFEQAQWSDATESYNKAIHLETQKNDENSTTTKNLAFYYNNRGLVFYHTMCHDEALRDFEEAIRIDPENAETYYNRGNVYLH